MDDINRTILKNAARSNGYMPTTADHDRVLALHERRLLSRTRVNSGLWVYRITEKGREALWSEVLASAALTPAKVPYDEITDPTQALLWFADEGHYEGTYRKGAGFVDALGLGIARRVLGLAADRPDRSLMPLTEALAARAAQSPVLTPEVVLRAMLTANEAAALDRAIAHMKAPLYSEYESLSSDEADSRAAHMRDVFASFIAGLDWRALLSPEQEDDYEARLAGTRPLDAPPPEVS